MVIIPNFHEKPEDHPRTVENPVIIAVGVVGVGSQRLFSEVAQAVLVGVGIRIEQVSDFPAFKNAGINTQVGDVPVPEKVAELSVTAPKSWLGAAQKSAGCPACSPKMQRKARRKANAAGAADSFWMKCGNHPPSRHCIRPIIVADFIVWA